MRSHREPCCFNKLVYPKSTVSLATFLAREKMVDAESKFRPFLEVCPWDSLHPLLWTEAELELLQGTCVA